MNNKTLISTLRKSKGWTQEFLAEESGLSVRTIQRLEAGDDASLETLRLVAEALNVSINELFEHVEDKEKEKEIELFSEEQTLQMNKRKGEENLFKMVKLIYFVLMLIIASFISKTSDNMQIILGTLWVGAFVLGFIIFKYTKYSWWEIRLDKKYPLTCSMLQNKNTNKEYFFWWKNKIARNVLMIFWGAVIPLIFILKYALHLF